MTSDIEAVFKRCTALGAIQLPSAGTLAHLNEHPFLAWCIHHAPEGERQTVGTDHIKEMITEAGIRHEATVIRDDYDEADVAPITYDTPENGFKLALEAAFDGIKVISQAPLLFRPSGFYGISDILEKRDDASSVFGDWHYVVKEIKSAKQFTNMHYLQAAYYTRALGLIQEYTPTNFLLTNGLGKTDEVLFSEYEELLDDAVSKYTAIRNGSIHPPAIYDECKNTEWEDYCNKSAAEAGDISILSGVGSLLRESMVSADVSTIIDVASNSEAELCKIHGIGPKVAVVLKTHAKAIISNDVVYRNKPLQFSQGKHIAYLDFEGFLPAVMPLELKNGTIITEPIWMIGMVIGGVFKYYFAGDPYGNTIKEPVQKMVDAFLDDLPKDCLIYHWGKYDHASMKRLLQEYRPDKLDILDYMYDMHKIITTSYALPTYGNGIKNVSKWCGFDFDFKYPDADAGSVNSVWTGLMDGSVKEIDAALGHILEYNEADCRMLECVYEKFKNMKECNT